MHSKIKGKADALIKHIESGGVYMHQRSRLSSVKIMVCFLFGTEPLSEPGCQITDCPLIKRKHNWTEYKTLSKHSIWMCRL